MSDINTISGNGGYITVGGVRLEVKKWTLRKKARLVERTHSGVTSTRYKKVVPDHEWSLEIPLDLDTLPDSAAGLVEGSEGTIVFQIGASGKAETLTETTVESVEEVDDNSDDIVRVAVSGKGGDLTRAV